MILQSQFQIILVRFTEVFPLSERYTLAHQRRYYMQQAPIAPLRFFLLNSNVSRASFKSEWEWLQN